MGNSQRKNDPAGKEKMMQKQGDNCRSPSLSGWGNAGSGERRQGWRSEKHRQGRIVFPAVCPLPDSFWQRRVAIAVSPPYSNRGNSWATDSGVKIRRPNQQIKRVMPLTKKRRKKHLISRTTNWEHGYIKEALCPRYSKRYPTSPKKWGEEDFMLFPSMIMSQFTANQTKPNKNCKIFFI